MNKGRPAVQAIVLPSAIGQGTVNAYLVLGRVPTLVDAGSGTAAARSALRTALQAADLRPEDVGRIVVTHTHADHCGGVAQVAAVSGAQVTAHATALAILADWPRACRSRAELFRRAAMAGAVPSDLLGGAVDWIARSADFGTSLGQDVRRIAGSDHVRIGSDLWQVIHTPGHTREHQCLYHASSGALLCGDALSRGGSPTPWLEPRKPDGSRPGTLSALVASWRGLGRLTVQVAWPGHGPAIRAHRMLIAHHLVDARALIAAARSALIAGGATVWEAIASTQSDITERNLPSALSRTVAALDWLVARGEAHRSNVDGVVRYAIAHPKAGRKAR